MEQPPQTNQPEQLPVQPTQQQPYAPQQHVGENPGQTLGIVSIIMTVPLGLSVVGIILGVISRNQSKKVNASTTLGTVGMVLGIVGTVLGFLGFLLFFLLVIVAASADPSYTTSTYQSL